MSKKRFWDTDPDEPIVCSILDVDFYKFTMGQFIYNHFPDVIVEISFKNRTKDVALTKIIPIEELQYQLDQVTKLRINNSELHFQRGTNEYGERMFCEPYLQFLKQLRLYGYTLQYEGDEIRLRMRVRWCEVTYWETMSISIINELYYRALLRKMSRFEQDALYAEGVRRLHDKIKKLKANPQIVFSDFGTRRRFSRKWQDYVVGVVAEELGPEQFQGTSNTFLAMKYGLLPIGTNAHELQMVIAGLMQDTDEKLLSSQSHMLKLWWKQYGESLSIFLPDTFGTTSFLKHLDPEMAQQWIGFRLDSDAVREGEEVIAYYKKHGIDPSTKKIVPSDGLTVDTMIALEARFRNRIGSVRNGWGTDLTNDLGFGNLSLVVKPTEANGIPLVKLSNNPAKATGDPQVIKRYKRVFDYGEHEAVECKS